MKKPPIRNNCKLKHRKPNKLKQLNQHVCFLNQIIENLGQRIEMLEAHERNRQNAEQALTQDERIRAENRAARQT